MSASGIYGVNLAMGRELKGLSLKLVYLIGSLPF